MRPAVLLIFIVILCFILILIGGCARTPPTQLEQEIDGQSGCFVKSTKKHSPAEVLALLNGNEYDIVASLPENALIFKRKSCK